MLNTVGNLDEQADDVEKYYNIHHSITTSDKI